MIKARPRLPRQKWILTDILTTSIPYADTVHNIFHIAKTILGNACSLSCLICAEMMRRRHRPQRKFRDVRLLVRPHWIQTLQNLHTMSGKQKYSKKYKNYKTKNASSVVIIFNVSIFGNFVSPTFVSNEVSVKRSMKTSGRYCLASSKKVINYIKININYKNMQNRMKICKTLRF